MIKIGISGSDYDKLVKIRGTDRRFVIVEEGGHLYLGYGELYFYPAFSEPSEFEKEFDAQFTRAVEGKDVQ